MSISRLMQMGAAGAGGEALAIEDVFSTYLYTGNGSTQTITNGIDLAGEGGLVWVKSRGSSSSNLLGTTDLGAGGNNALSSNLTNAAFVSPFESFNSDGFTVDIDGGTAANGSGIATASWTFRKAPRFFDVVTYTGDSVSGREIAHNLGVTPGCIIVKCTSNTGSWFTYHRSLGATKYLQLQETFAASTSDIAWNNTEPTENVFTVSGTANVNYSGFTYVAYLFAHDPLGPSGDGSDGLIACGSFTTDGSGNATVDLGWEPQWLLIKASAETGNWFLFDTMRGMPVSTTVSSLDLNPNTSDAEGNGYKFQLSATGFTISAAGLNRDWTYIAIRRGPMRQPESGTEVFAISDRQATEPAYVSNFPVDFALWTFRPGSDRFATSRMTGTNYLLTNSTAAQATSSPYVFDYSDGWNSSASASTNHYSWMFRRAPGFFDVVAYTGDGTDDGSHQIPHNLKIAPEMIISKTRDLATSWVVWHEGLGQDGSNKYFVAILNSSGAKGIFGFGDASGSVNPQGTDTYFPVGGSNTNRSGNKYITYLFATLPGVSKVGSYTGNGTSQTIDCGFTTGARFILIKRTDSTGDWYIWDTERGIVTGNDPHLSLNTTAAEVTTDDSIDPDSSGFIVNQVAATNINVSSASYIFYAIA